MKILVNNVTPLDAPIIIAKLMEDIQKHNDIIQGFSKLSFIIIYDNTHSSVVIYDAETKKIIEKKL